MVKNDAYRDSRELLDGYVVPDIECLDRVYLLSGLGEGFPSSVGG